MREHAYVCQGRLRGREGLDGSGWTLSHEPPLWHALNRSLLWDSFL